MTDIYCVTHKEIASPRIDNFHTIQVGDDPNDFADLRDNRGANISNKNSTWSEATAFYYIWKNCSGSAVGLCHYRRFLVPNYLRELIHEDIDRPYDETSKHGLGNYASGFHIEQDLMFKAMADGGVSTYSSAFDELLINSEIILPRSNRLPEGGFLKQYLQAHPAWPMFELLAIISKQDNKLARRAHHFFSQFERAYWNNLFVMRWELFEEYCEFLFPLLFELERKIELPDDPYQKRVFAFLSERLLNFWIWDRKPKRKEIDWCMTEAIEGGEESHQRRLQPRTIAR